MTDKILYKINYTLLAGETPVYNNVMYTHAYSRKQAFIHMKHRLGRDYTRVREACISEA